MQLILGDCLEVMSEIPAGSVDMICTDLPYGTTQCKWDAVVPFAPLWEQYRRVLKQTGVVALTASQPFTSALIMSNVEMFKHEWVWIKNRGSNFANTVREPMKEHESVLIFSRGKWTYNKQMQERTGGGINMVGAVQKEKGGKTDNYGNFKGVDITLSKLRVPSSWQKFNCEVGLHPTQKPVGLMEYLIRTYTNDGEFVLDSCMGSGTTGIACRNLGRRFIGIEKDETIFATASKRLSEHAASVTDGLKEMI